MTSAHHTGPWPAEGRALKHCRSVLARQHTIWRRALTLLLRSCWKRVPWRQPRCSTSPATLFMEWLETKCSGHPFKFIKFYGQVKMCFSSRRFVLLPLLTKCHRRAPAAGPSSEKTRRHLHCGWRLSPSHRGGGEGHRASLIISSFSKSFCKSPISNNKTCFNLLLTNITHIPFIKNDKVIFV